METHIFASHGFKHLLQLDPELLDVVDDDTGLTEKRKKVPRSAILKHFTIISEVSPLKKKCLW